MFIRHHTHCSVESVVERGAAAPTLSQCVEEVVRLSKLQRAHTAQGIETGDTVRDGLEAWYSETMGIYINPLRWIGQ